MRANCRWRSFRINYHEEDKTELILKTFARVVACPRDYGAEAVIIKTHWAAGPHVRLHLRLGEETFPAKRQVIEDFSLWLATHPSCTKIEQSDYRRRADELAKLESYQGEVPLLEENNIIYEIFEHPSSLSRLEQISNDFQEKSLPLLIELAAIKHQDPGGFWLGLAQMLATVGFFCGSPGLSRGHLSFRSHAESFLAEADHIRPSFEDFDNRMRDRLVESIERIQHCMSTRRLSEDSPSLLVKWLPVLLKIKPELDEAVAELDPATFDRMPYNQEKGRPFNDFVRRAMRGPLKKLGRDPKFVSYRMLLSLFYEALPVLSVRPSERFALCFILAQACEQVYNVDWQEYFK